MLPDDRLLSLVALLRDTLVPAPAMTPEEWQAFLDRLRPHGVYPLMAYRLRAWPEDCRPPAVVMDHLNRVFLYAAARSMRAGRQIQTVVDALEAAGIESVLLKGPALTRTVYPSISGSSTDSGATMTAATNCECPQTDSDKTVKFIDLNLCESEDSSERAGLQLVVVRHDGSHPAHVRHL